MKNSQIANIIKRKYPISINGHITATSHTVSLSSQLNPVNDRTITHRIIPIKYPRVQVISFLPWLLCYTSVLHHIHTTASSSHLYLANHYYTTYVRITDSGIYISIYQSTFSLLLNNLY